MTIATCETPLSKRAKLAQQVYVQRIDLRRSPSPATQQLTNTLRWAKLDVEKFKAISRKRVKVHQIKRNSHLKVEVDPKENTYSHEEGKYFDTTVDEERIRGEKRKLSKLFARIAAL